MAYLEVEVDLIKRLQEALQVETGVHMPEKRPKEFIRVWREGGARENHVIDRVGIGIYCWSDTEYHCMQLANKVADYMQTLTFRDGYDTVEQETMMTDADPDKREPRWYLSYTLKTHKPQ